MTVFMLRSTPGVRGVLAALLLMTMTSMPCLAAPALSGGIVSDLRALEQRLDSARDAELTTLEERALSQAARLAGGNAADRWARALYLQLASQAAIGREAFEEAAEHLSRARRLSGVEAATRARWQHREADLRLRAGQPARAAELLADWLDGHAGEAADYWRLADVQARLERWAAARAAVDTALASGASPTEARLMLAAGIYQQAGEDDKALGMLERLLARSPDDPDTWRRAAGLAQRLGRHAQAAALWEAAWRQGVLGGSDALERRIRLHLAADTPARAAELLATALEAGRLDDSLARRRLLARAFEQARARPSALEAWRRVAEQSGEAGDWLYLGQLAAGWGEDARAREALTRARHKGSEQAADWLDYLDQHPLADR